MIRAAEKGDAADICGLWNDIIAETTVTFTSDLKTTDAIGAIIADPRRAVLVAQVDGRFAGFALIGPFRSGPGYAKTVEHSVFLLPHAHGQGLGRALMARLSAAAQKMGHHVMIAAISGSNSAAVRFHHSLGFEKVAHLPKVGWKFDAWHDLILMQKTIGFAPDTLDCKG